MIMLPVMFRNNWMPTLFEDFLNTDLMPRTGNTAPAVNVKESETAYTMIENKCEHKNEDKKHHYLRREFSYSNYEQNYTLPDDVERDKISAKVEDGILTVTMPKMAKEEKKLSKAIEVC